MRKIGTKQTATMSQAAKILNAIFKTELNGTSMSVIVTPARGGSWRHIGRKKLHRHAFNQHALVFFWIPARVQRHRNSSLEALRLV